VFDFIIIGKGLIGSAALRYVSQFTRNVAVVGPDEPTYYATHDGVFASHYDEGRSTSLLGKDPIWAHLTRRAIERYQYLEQQTGLHFYDACGRLCVYESHSALDEVTNNARYDRPTVVQHERLTGSGISARFPMFMFANTCSATFEPAPAGLIRPRVLLRAQLADAICAGAVAIDEEVQQLRVTRDCVHVVTHTGRRLQSARVLLATGAYASCDDLMTRRIALRVKAETVLLVEVPIAALTRFANMPTLSFAIDSPTLSGIYMTPPLRYPNGRHYLKLGCNTSADVTLVDRLAIQIWMQRGPSHDMTTAMLGALRLFMSSLPVSSYVSKPCFVAYTPHGRPFVDQLSDRVFVATGCNGAAAQCSDTLGQLGALLMLGMPWPGEFDRNDFRVILTS
jgi:N-methyl-L-tryptophan oxidase